MEEAASATHEISTTYVEIESAVESISEKAQVGAISANEINNKAFFILFV
jgi:hypothetical protein